MQRLALLFCLALGEFGTPAASEAAEISTRFDVHSLNGSGYPLDTQFAGLFQFVEFENAVYFVTNDYAELKSAIWRSTGTAASTTRIDTGSLPYTGEIHLFGAQLLMSGFTSDLNSELWKFDLRTSTTSLVADINPGPAPSYAGSFHTINRTILFQADDGVHERELWRMQADLGSVERLFDVAPVPQYSVPITDLANYRNRAYFLLHGLPPDSETTLWSTDGTRNGTSKVVGFTSITSVVSQFFEFKDRLCFSAVETSAGILVCTDGTQGGTQIVRGLAPGQHGIASSENRFFFRARSQENELFVWSSDGTANGTRKLDIPAENGSNSDLGLIRIRNRVFAAAPSRAQPSVGSTLWSVDSSSGVAEELLPVESLGVITRLTDFNGVLVFVVDRFDQAEQRWVTDIWRSNGTRLGTSRVARFRQSFASAAPSFSVGKNSIYFGVDEGRGLIPWRWTNRPPQATDDRFELSDSRRVKLAVGENDVDSDGELDGNGIAIVALPRFGSAEIRDGVIEYTPSSRIPRADSFSYTTQDTQGSISNVATVSIVPKNGGSFDLRGIAALLSLLCVLQLRGRRVIVRKSTRTDSNAIAAKIAA